MTPSLTSPIQPPVKKRESKAGRPSKSTHWLVYKLGGRKAAMLGTVNAPDEDSALARAIEEFHVSPGERRRLIVRPAGDKAQAHPPPR
jgi:hypothetical protein